MEKVAYFDPIWLCQYLPIHKVGKELFWQIKPQTII